MTDVIGQLVGSETYADAHLALTRLAPLTDELDHDQTVSVLAAAVGNPAVASLA